MGDGRTARSRSRRLRALCVDLPGVRGCQRISRRDRAFAGAAERRGTQVAIAVAGSRSGHASARQEQLIRPVMTPAAAAAFMAQALRLAEHGIYTTQDRKSTRLNSSH